MSAEFSFPKDKIKIVLTEKIHSAAAELLIEAGYQPTILPNALNEKEILEVIADAHVIGVRSRTKITEHVLNHAKRLLVVGCFSVGTDQVELPAARSHGIPVFNAPHSSTRSVAELAIGMMISLARRIDSKSMAMHHGVWDKSLSNAVELRNKTVGLIGYGNIGQQVGVLAEAIGMNVCFYDVVKKLPLGRATALENLGELLMRSDFVSLHVPGGAGTKNLITNKELLLMKEGSYLINLSRGQVVEIEALVEQLKSKQLSGAALDVFPVEPVETKGAFNSPLCKLENVILTPHIGGNTEEAQKNIGREVAQSLLAFLETGSTSGAVNFPNVNLPAFPKSHRILNVHRNMPGALSDINREISTLGLNIDAQSLSTFSDIGYMIVDIGKGTATELGKRVSELPQSIKTRILY